jgi:hypothetical protein
MSVCQRSFDEVSEGFDDEERLTLAAKVRFSLFEMVVQERGVEWLCHQVELRES